MARKSAAVITLEAQGLAGAFTPDKPQPPAELTREQREEWNAIVGRMPEGWFPRESHPLLVQLCRHICEARRISGIITAHTREPEVSETWLKDYDRLLKMREREGRAASSLSTRLRLTQQSTIDKRTQKPSEPPAPWDDE